MSAAFRPNGWMLSRRLAQNVPDCRLPARLWAERKGAKDQALLCAGIGRDCASFPVGGVARGPVGNTNSHAESHGLPGPYLRPPGECARLPVVERKPLEEIRVLLAAEPSGFPGT